jgi:hypothetical protein
MPDCEKNVLDSASLSPAQPGANDVFIITRPDGTSYLQKWSVMLAWIQSSLTGSTPPTASAGSDQSITLPTSSVTLSSVGSTGGTGTIVSYLWTKFSGPAGGTITTPSASSTTVTGLPQGIFTYRLTITNSNSQTAQDDVVITVNASVASYNTMLTFASSTTDTVAGVTGIVGAINSTQKFEFNSILTQTGTPQRMDMFLSGIQVMAVNFLSDYAGQGFSYTHTNGTQYTGNFANGAVTL